MRMAGMSAGILCVVALLLLSGCGGAQNKTDGAAAPKPGEKADANPAPAPAGLMLTEAPPGARDVIAVKKDAKEGDEVVIRGRIGGAPTNVFTSGYAIMTIVDMSLVPCNEKPGDGCKTPWDYCCDDKEDILAAKATIQLLGAGGKVLKQEFKGMAGMDHLSVVVVKGKVGKRDDPKNLIINATGIFVEKSADKKKS